MKKIIITSCVLFSLMACGNSTSKPESKQLSKEELIAKKLEESKCKVDFSMHLLENTMNTQARLINKGFKKDLDAFHELQKDTLITCDSIHKAWDNLSAKIH
jgi:uncharacterized lipoprotein NlpE involved in copper resistance